jgi:hypothetical protein
MLYNLGEKMSRFLYRTRYQGFIQIGVQNVGDRLYVIGENT